MEALAVAHVVAPSEAVPHALEVADNEGHGDDENDTDAHGDAVEVLLTEPHPDCDKLLVPRRVPEKLGVPVSVGEAPPLGLAPGEKESVAEEERESVGLPEKDGLNEASGVGDSERVLQGEADGEEVPVTDCALTEAECDTLPVLDTQAVGESEPERLPERVGGRVKDVDVERLPEREGLVVPHGEEAAVAEPTAEKDMEGDTESVAERAGAVGAPLAEGHAVGEPDDAGDAV
jgi:hypothetical protein